MTVSGSTDFELDVAEYVEEAFERCGLEARTGYDLKTAKRSLNIMFADWANRGLNQWTIKEQTLNVVEGQRVYPLSSDIIDVLAVVVRRDSTDYTIDRVSRDQYLSIPTKESRGRVTQFFLNRQITPDLQVWPVPDNSTDILVYNCLTRIDDADTMTNTIDVPFRFYPCLAAGLAYYISLKRAPERVQMLKAVYEEEMRRAVDEDRDRASFQISPSLRNYRIV
tara:strand:- start:1290 stop:1958 length:669 start_codon:yes stop_codon:yes gene_type:complete